jgi:hypothetical protein
LKLASLKLGAEVFGTAGKIEWETVIRLLQV